MSGVFPWPPVRRKIPGFGRARGNRPLGEREDGRANDGRDGALRTCVEFADGFDSVAEKLDADRARGLGRKKVHDAAALRELAGHFDHFRARVANRTEMSDEGVEANFVVGFERASEEVVAFGRAVAPKRGRDGRDKKIGLARSETIESGGAAFENVRVRASRVPRERVK